MATTQPVKTDKPAKTKKEPLALVQRIHQQLTKGVLSNKLDKEDLAMLEGHISRLKAIVS